MVCENGQTAHDHVTIAMLIHQKAVHRTQVHTVRHPVTANRLKLNIKKRKKETASK